MSSYKPLVRINGIVSELSSSDTLDTSIAAVAGVDRTITEFTATSGQTAFSVPTYTTGHGLVDVFFNGSKLKAVDFTETNSTTVTLSTGALLNTDIVIVTYKESQFVGITNEVAIAFAVAL